MSGEFLVVVLALALLPVGKVIMLFFLSALVLAFAPFPAVDMVTVLVFLLAP